MVLLRLLGTHWQRTFWKSARRYEFSTCNNSCSVTITEPKSWYIWSQQHLVPQPACCWNQRGLASVLLTTFCDTHERMHNFTLYSKRYVHEHMHTHNFIYTNNIIVDIVHLITVFIIIVFFFHSFHVFSFGLFSFQSLVLFCYCGLLVGLFVCFDVEVCLFCPFLPIHNIHNTTKQTSHPHSFPDFSLKYCSYSAWKHPIIITTIYNDQKSITNYPFTYWLILNLQLMYYW